MALGALAVGIVGLHADGLTEKQSFTTQVPSVTGEEVLARHFPAGAGSPVVVIANADKTGQVQAALRGHPRYRRRRAPGGQERLGLPAGHYVVQP